MEYLLYTERNEYDAFMCGSFSADDFSLRCKFFQKLKIRMNEFFKTIYTKYIQYTLYILHIFRVWP